MLDDVGGACTGRTRDTRMHKDMHRIQVRFNDRVLFRVNIRIKVIIIGQDYDSVRVRPAPMQPGNTVPK